MTREDGTSYGDDVAGGDIVSNSEELQGTGNVVGHPIASFNSLNSEALTTSSGSLFLFRTSRKLREC